MGIEPVVMHDKDSETPGAVVFNQPILEAVGDATKVFVVENCIEDVLGYTAPRSNKPYKAYVHIKNNWTDYNSISESWREIVSNVFALE